MLVEAGRWIAGAAGIPLGVLLLAGLTVAVPILLVGSAVLFARAAHVDRRTALAAVELEPYGHGVAQPSHKTGQVLYV